MKVSFTLKVLGGLEPSACNNAEFKSSYMQAAQNYADQHLFQELGRRYALNIANGRFLWRNRVGAEQIEVVVKSGEFEKCFNALQFSTKTMENTDRDVAELGEMIAKTLASKDEFLILEIDCFVKTGKA